MSVKIEESWKQRLSDEFEKPYFKSLTDFVRQEYSSRTIYPPAKLIFNAFDQCPFDRVKVVIVGQDPYHEPTLTVRAHQAGSHQHKGWEEFTDSAIYHLANERENLVFFLWGAYAQRKGENIDANRHLVLKSPHPSPLSAHRGFFGNKHFSRANAYLLANGISPIDW